MNSDDVINFVDFVMPAFLSCHSEEERSEDDVSFEAQNFFEVLLWA